MSDDALFGVIIVVSNVLSVGIGAAIGVLLFKIRLDRAGRRMDDSFERAMAEVAP